MSLMAGDIGSMFRAQQSAQADRQQAGQAVQNMRDAFAHLRPSVPTDPMITQLPTDGSYSGNMYRRPFMQQRPMMDMRGIGGLLAGLLGGFGGGFGGGYGGGYPVPSAYMRQRGPTQEYRPEDGPRQPSLQERQQAESALAAGANPAARLGGTIGVPIQGAQELSLTSGGPFKRDPSLPPLRSPVQPQAPLIRREAPIINATELPQPLAFQGGFGQPQGGFQQFQPRGGFGQPQGGFGQPPMGGAPGGKGGAKGGGMFGQPSYGMQARYSSPFGNLF